jgi:hypothetical protein
VRLRLLFIGGMLLLLGVVLAVLLRSAAAPRRAERRPPTTTRPPAPPTTTAASPPATTRPSPQPVPMTWQGAGAFVVHTHDVDPEWLGQRLRAASFDWVAVYLGQAGSPNAIDPGWIERFRQASGLPVGGWSSLGDDPAGDAAFAVGQIEANRLSFYVADAEGSYQGEPQRSQQFVSAFRAAEPKLPAGLSSLCDARALGLTTWASAGFAFLPQAYVNDFGLGVAPAACVRAAAGAFPRTAVHPTVASYDGRLGLVPPQRFARLLAQAGTIGFSVFPAESGMTAGDWQEYGRAIATEHIAVPAP